mmetsp:Transcript_2504/g.5569  ORF Transcript_2504/g.5569 Transcript_2504/m.5569 type:complete len:313 (-) Transcript_2504:1418-2356(-)
MEELELRSFLQILLEIVEHLLRIDVDDPAVLGLLSGQNRVETRLVLGLTLGLEVYDNPFDAQARVVIEVLELLLIVSGRDPSLGEVARYFQNQTAPLCIRVSIFLLEVLAKKYNVKLMREHLLHLQRIRAIFANKIAKRFGLERTKFLLDKLALLVVREILAFAATNLGRRVMRRYMTAPVLRAAHKSIEFRVLDVFADACEAIHVLRGFKFGRLDASFNTLGALEVYTFKWGEALAVDLDTLAATILLGGIHASLVLMTAAGYDFGDVRLKRRLELFVSGVFGVHLFEDDLGGCYDFATLRLVREMDIVGG